MKQSNIKNIGIILFSLTSMMVSTVYAQDSRDSEVEQQIIQQGEQALMQMQLEFKHNAFWNSSNSKEMVMTLDKQAFTPETAATTDCDKNNYPAEEKKTSGNLPVNPGQTG